MDDDLEAIATLGDDELIALTEGRRPDAAECALSELYYRGHPQTAAIAKRLFDGAKDEWLRGSALSKLLRLRDPGAWDLAEATIDSAPPQVLARIVEEMATTDDPDVFAKTSLIACARQRLADLPALENSLVELFHRRFDGR
jgi:hypothetical protein